MSKEDDAPRGIKFALDAHRKPRRLLVSGVDKEMIRALPRLLPFLEGIPDKIAEAHEREAARLLDVPSENFGPLAPWIEALKSRPRGEAVARLANFLLETTASTPTRGRPQHDVVDYMLDTSSPNKRKAQRGRRELGDPAPRGRPKNK